MNKPTYKIGDRLPDTPIEVVGRMTTSSGTVRYWLKNGDNTVVVNDESLTEILNLFLKTKPA